MLDPRNRIVEETQALQFLKDNGVQANVHYPIPLYKQTPALNVSCGNNAYPVTERTIQRILRLPLYPELTYEQQDYVAQLFDDFYGGPGKDGP